MKYFKTYEGFKKDYMKKIDLKDFKKIKKGTKLMYMGGPVEVLDNNGYVLKLKGEDGRTFTVNKSQFDHGGMIREGKAPDADKAMRDLKKKGSQIDWLDDADDDTKKIWKKAGVNPEDENTVILYSYVSHQWDDAKKILKKHNVDFKELEDPNSAGESFIVFVKESINELRSDMISGTSGRRIESLEDRKYELKKDVKGAQIGDFTNGGFTNVTLPKGTIIYNLPGGVFADHFSLKNKYASRSSRGPQYFEKPTFSGISIRQMPDILAAIEKNSKVLESVNEAVYIPSNIEEFAKRKGILPLVKKIGRWAEKAGKRINGGTAIGKYYDTLILDLKHQGGEIRVNIDTDEVKLHGTVVTDPKSFKKALKESINEDMEGVKKDIMDHWYELYGEKFINKYPAVAKILKQRKNVDARELSRIWDETYGEDFKEKYPAMWDKLSK